MPQIDPTIKALATTIGELETGGSSPDAYTVKGQSGEYGRYQMMPETQKNYFKKYVGDANAAPTVENQNKAIYGFIQDKKTQGFNPAQIMSMWNAGEGRPDAYKQNHRGTNSAGVLFDTPSYVQRGSKIYMQKKGQTSLGMQPDASAPQLQPEQNLGQKLAGRLGDAGSAIGDAFSGKMAAPLISAPLQAAGAAAGAVGDTIGAGLDLIPGVKQAEQFVGKGVAGLANTGIGKRIVGGAQITAQEHPELAKDTGAAFNIAGLVGGGIGGKVASTAAKEGLANAAKEGLMGAAVKGLSEKSYQKAASRALETGPKLSDIKTGIKSGNLSEAGSLAPDPAKESTIRYLAEQMKNGAIPKNGSKAAIAVRAEKAAVDESKLLEKQLTQSGSDIVHTVQPEQIQQMMQKVVQRAGESATSGEAPSKELLQVFLKHIPFEGDITPIDILKARRAVGAFVKANRGDWNMRGVLTGFKSARDAFWDESRDLLAEVAPKGVDVLKSLEKQTALYRVSDYIAPLVKKEITSGKEGLVKRVVKGAGKEIIHRGLQGAGLGLMSHLIP